MKRLVGFGQRMSVFYYDLLPTERRGSTYEASRGKRPYRLIRVWSWAWGLVWASLSFDAGSFTCDYEFHRAAKFDE